MEQYDEYLKQLSSKNSDYVYTVHKLLMETGLSDDEAKTLISEYLPEILEQQAKDLPAKNFLGTPTTFVKKHTASASNGQEQKKKENDNVFLMWLDNFLLLFGILAAVNGGVALVSKNPQTYGILTLIFMSAGAAVVMYYMYKYFYAQDNDRKRQSVWKSFGVMTLAMILWLGIFWLAALLPKSINPELSPTVTLVLGALALGLRYFLKKRYNIKSSMATYNPNK